MKHGIEHIRDMQRERRREKAFEYLKIDVLPRVAIIGLLVITFIGACYLEGLQLASPLA